MNNSAEPTGQRFSKTVDKMKSELDRLVEMAWTRGEEAIGQFRSSEAKCDDWCPDVDVVETNDSLVVFMNLPGVSAPQVDITLVGNTLEISTHVESLTLQPADRVFKRERPTGHLHRSITLPVAVDHDSAVAHCERGVFKVEMQKSADSRAKKVPINETTEQHAHSGM